MNFFRFLQKCESEKSSMRRSTKTDGTRRRIIMKERKMYITYKQNNERSHSLGVLYINSTITLSMLSMISECFID